MIKQRHINLLHGPMLHGGGFMASQLKRKLNIPMVSHSRGSDVQVVSQIGYGAQLNDANIDKIKTTLKQSDKIIAVSTINKQNIVDLGAHPDNVVVIPNGILIDEISAVPYEDLRAKYSLLDDEFVIITVGRNRPVKRMELLFEALQLLKDYKKIKCLCVGPKENLMALAQKYDVLDKIVLTGQIPTDASSSLKQPYPELINAYRLANVYVSTSYVESFGNAAAEALACGTPIIIGQKHGVEDIVKLNETGWVMSQETPRSLADLLIDRYNNHEQMSAIRNEIKGSVSHLTWRNIAKQTVTVYKSIL
jgi:glycosyltransferase involved in cell wall biosynthesis